MECESVGLGLRLLDVRTVGHGARHFRDLGDPSAVGFAVNFKAKLQVATPCAFRRFTLCHSLVKMRHSGLCRTLRNECNRVKRISHSISLKKLIQKPSVSAASSAPVVQV